MTTKDTATVPPALPVLAPLVHGQRDATTGAIALNSAGFANAVYREIGDFLGVDLTMPHPDAVLASFFEEGGRVPKLHSWSRKDIQSWPDGDAQTFSGRGYEGHRVYQQEYNRQVGYIIRHLHLVFLPNPGLPVSLTTQWRNAHLSQAAVGHHYVYVVLEHRRGDGPLFSQAGWPCFHKIAASAPAVQGNADADSDEDAEE